MVVGGRLLSELNKLSAFRQWAQAASLSGTMRTENDEKVAARAEELEERGACRSDDPHVVALAQVSGARLLYSNDINLHRDFTNKNVVDDPRGKVYSTNKSKEFTDAHQRLLRRKDLCRRSG